MYTYTCLFCGRRGIVYPLLDFGDGLHDLEALGWDIAAGKCAQCIEDDARAERIAWAKREQSREVETPMGEAMGGN